MDKLQAVLDSIPSGIVLVDRDGRVEGCNAAWRHLLDLPETLFAGGLPRMIDVLEAVAARGDLGLGDPAELARQRLACIFDHAPFVTDSPGPHGRTLRLRAGRMDDGGVVLLYVDVTERVRDTAALVERTRELEKVSRELEITLTHMNQGIGVCDPDGRLVLWNQQYAYLFDTPLADLEVGMPLSEVLHRQRERGYFQGDPEAYVEEIAAAVAEGRETVRIAELPSGRIVRTVRTGRPDGGWVATHEDVTEAEKAARLVAHAARHDLLTDLKNRAGFADELAALAQKGEPFALLLIDLDRFKAVNDTFGHAVGDKLLQEVAARMRACVRAGDLVARLGGDEFALAFAPGREAAETADAIARRLLEAMTAPYVIDGQELAIGASIGIALSPEHGTSPEELTRNADAALYEVKAAGRNNVRVYDEVLAAADRQRRELETLLPLALGRGELHLLYQPMVDLEDGRVTGAEALLRWQHPTRGSISPHLFVPIAEQIGSIRAIGSWVLRQALADAARWPDHVRVAVNVSPLQLGPGEFAALLASEIPRHGLTPGRVEVEVTEGVLMSNGDAALAELRRIRELGVTVALDDFGTGYASLSYLRQFPFDRIKIDRSFVADIEDPVSAAIVGGAAAIARALGIAITAEGIETPAQTARLRELGCTSAQGYLFGNPVPAGDLAF